MIVDEPHRRFNPLTQEWVLVSPHRAKRPWQGQQEAVQVDDRPAYDPSCYLCPGNKRIQGDSNPKYETTYVFQNDFSAVKTEQQLVDEYGKEALPKNSEDSKDSASDIEKELYQAEQTTGKCMVICFSPRHDQTLASMTPDQISKVVEVWQDVYRSAQEDPEIKYCQIFENKGAAMGCSNPHPHGQVWMTSVVPEEPAKERDSLTQYIKRHGSSSSSVSRGLLGDYVDLELEKKDRVVYANDAFAVLIPYWAVWPFETMIVSRRKVSRITDLTSEERLLLADAISQITIRYDNLFKTNFPYSMGVHQAPVAEEDNNNKDPVEHLHLHFYPPLLRSATVRKFLVGFELLGMPQRDLTPETAASMLRNLSGTVRFDKE